MSSTELWAAMTDAIEAQSGDAKRLAVALMSRIFQSTENIPEITGRPQIDMMIVRLVVGEVLQ